MGRNYFLVRGEREGDYVAVVAAPLCVRQSGQAMDAQNSFRIEMAVQRAIS